MVSIMTVCIRRRAPLLCLLNQRSCIRLKSSYDDLDCRLQSLIPLCCTTKPSRPGCCGSFIDVHSQASFAKIVLPLSSTVLVPTGRGRLIAFRNM